MVQPVTSTTPLIMAMRPSSITFVAREMLVSPRVVPRVLQPIRKELSIRYTSTTAPPPRRIKSKPSQPSTSANTIQDSSSTSTSSSSSTRTPLSAAISKSSTTSSPPRIPHLPRPLGVPLPPIPSPKTYVYQPPTKFGIGTDQERREAERKALMKEAMQGYYHDYHRARKAGGGKLWMAPNVLIREEKALYFPNIGGTNLRGVKLNSTDLLRGKTTLLTILNTRLSEEHQRSFVTPVMEDQKGKPGFQYIQINHQANPLKATLLSFFASGLKRNTPEENWDTYLLSKGAWSDLDINYPLGLENKLLGYVFLIDANCKIRWAGCGMAYDEEVQALRAATEVLMGRAGQGGSSGGSVSS